MSQARYSTRSTAEGRGHRTPDFLALSMFEICPLTEADAFNLKAPIRGKPECDCMRIFLFTAHSVSLRTSREEKNQACGVILLLRRFR